MPASITSDILSAQITELRARLRDTERDRDRYRDHALAHAANHRAFRHLVRKTHLDIDAMRKHIGQADQRISALTRQVTDFVASITSGRIVVMRRPALRVDRPPRV